MLVTTSIIFEPLRSIEFAMLLGTCGIAAGGTMAFAVNPVILRLFPVVILLPAGVTMLIDSSSQHTLTAVMTCIFVFYITRASQAVHDDYWRALRNQHLLEDRARELERISATDTLTQLRNRMYFEAQFEAQWRRAFRQRGALAVLLLDLDHFKQINDEYGHAFGDSCLKEVAKVLTPAVSHPDDVLARYGGGEYIVLLSNADADGARIVADRLMQAVRKLELPFGEERIHLTCSIGTAATRPISADRAYRLINEAGKALSQAKQDGRDRFVVFNGMLSDTQNLASPHISLSGA
jgi:diguanylate cyclase (GGDEF)-like protein